MKRRLFNSAALFGVPMGSLALQGCGGGDDPPPATTTKTDYPKVKTLLDRLVATNVVPCASVLIRQAGQEVYYYQAGLGDVASNKAVTRDAIFRLFSMTKPIVAAGLLTLVDDGVVSLNDLVTKYIPEFANLGVYVGESAGVVQTVPARPMHVKDLLTHTAGFSYWFYPGEPVSDLYAKDPGIGTHEDWRFNPALGGSDGLIKTLAKLPLVNQPGDKWHYSMSLEVAGFVIERATGESLDKFLKRKIFDPLGMKDTGFAVSSAQAGRLTSLYTPKTGGGIQLIESGATSPLLKTVVGFAGGGGLVSTVDDYSRFAEMLRRGGELDGKRVVSAASVRTMMTNQLNPGQLGELPFLAAFGLGGNGDGLGFGLAGAVVLNPPTNGVPAYRGEYAWGGAASTTFWVDPENQLTVVFMTQLQPLVEGVPRDALHSAVY